MNAPIPALALALLAVSAWPAVAQQQAPAMPAVYVDPGQYANGPGQFEQYVPGNVSPYQLAARAEPGEAPVAPQPAQAGCDTCGSSCGGSTCCGSACCDRCCRTHGLIVGADISFLKPHHSNGNGMSGLLAIGGAPGVGGVETDLEAAFRGWLGWQSAGGIGARVRYWDFDHGYGEQFLAGPVILFPPFGPQISSVRHDWDVSAIDAEVFRSLYFDCGADVTFSAGLRYVDYSESVGAFNGDVLQIGRSKGMTGLGMVTGLEVRQRLGYNLGMFSHLRGSVVMGDETNQAFEFGFVLQENQIDDVKFIYEAQAGLEYIIPVYCGGYWFVRGGAEVQYWDGFGVDNVGLIQDNASVGFGGLFFSFGMQR
jgi:hypothetical protein